MANERTPILPSSAAAQPPAAHPRRRLAFIAAALVAIVTLVVVIINVSVNFSAAKAPGASAATTSSPATASSPASSSSFTPTVTFPADAHGRRDLLPYCEEKFFTQNLNQFVADGGGGTYEQRYFVCGQQFFNKENGTIFFYNGNEADVLLYLNNTGLMWENAEEFNAVMVFAEHRYFGKSMPFGDAALDHLEFLSSAQALADFAVLIDALKDEWQANVPVIGFGGSYGGMLGTWFRLKYPHLMDGVIAASAPVLHFMNDPDHPVDSEAFQRIVTFDMSSAAGASENCVANARKAKLAGFRLSATPEGRQTIATAFKLCNPEAFQTPEASRELPDMLIGVFGSLAMGNYPYPSSYITEGGAPLPTYPVRAACEHLAPDFGDDDEAVLAALRDAAGVFLNATGELQCYFPTPNDTVSKASKTDVNLWSYIECSELYMPFSSDGVHDVASPTTQNVTRDAEECFEMWGVHVRPNWAVTQYGGLKAIRASSNIVFSNGNFDPWSGTGVLETQSETVVALPIEGGAHHVDLFFQHPMDPPSLTQARETEKQHMRKWVKEFYDHKASLAGDKKM